MKKVIDGKMYNTETATTIAVWENSYSQSDFNYCCETLYQSKKGQYFIVGEGGARSDYASSCGNSSGYGHQLWLVTREKAIAWCEERDRVETLETHFSDAIEEG